MSAKKASASKEATQLFNLREDDCSALRAEVDQMEADWSKLTSDLSNIQEQLQQVHPFTVTLHCFRYRVVRA